MITQEYLKSILHYNPDTGVWTWRIDNGKQCWVGKQAGSFSKSTNYNRINFDGKEYRCSRLAWFYMTGKWPKNEIDHENTIKWDDRWVNLREASRSKNGCNIGKRKNNTSGYKGVSWYKRYAKWEMSLTVNNKVVARGLYETKDEAAEAYVKAALKYHGEFARLD